VPRADQLEFFGDGDAQRLFSSALDRWRELGVPLVEIDIAPFLAAGRLLYEGPWVAERYAAIKSFFEANPAALHPVTRQIIERGRSLTAVAAFEAAYRLAELRRPVDTVWRDVDAMLTPTTGTTYSLDAVAAEPIRLNNNLGYYTNFVNLLDLCAIALPAGYLPGGLPWGTTLVAPAFRDESLLRFGAEIHGRVGTTVRVLASRRDDPGGGLRRPPQRAATKSSADGARCAAGPCNAHGSALPVL